MPAPVADDGGGAFGFSILMMSSTMSCTIKPKSPAGFTNCRFCCALGVEGEVFVAADAVVFFGDAAEGLAPELLGAAAPVGLK